jgi:chitin synthase
VFQFLDPDFVAVFQQRSGQDITQPLNLVLDGMNSTYREQHMACLNTVFLVGTVDFRNSARCQVQNWLLIFFAALLMGSIALKCLLSFFF